MSRLDYSKWDHIEVSDDEDDTHPNIDTPSLFRWRHQARVDRMEKEKVEKEKVESGHQVNKRKLLEMQQKIKEAEDKKQADELSALMKEKAQLEKQEQEWQKKEDELRKKEKLTPWNIDTICKEGMSKTIINKTSTENTDNLTEDEKWERQKTFTDKNKTLIKKFGMFQNYNDSNQFLCDNAHLVCEETANYLVLWCIDLQLEEKGDLMAHVAHQTIVMQFILELARTMKVDPRACVRNFFERIKTTEKAYLDAFNDELEAFKGRVRERAAARIKKAMEEVEEEERQKRLGPGGLDPVEVFETLPEDWKQCFETKDVEMLKEVVTKYDKAEAELHLDRCIKSGLWDPNPGDKAEAKSDEKSDEKGAGDDVYEELD